MIRDIIFLLSAYFSGNILYAKLFSSLLHKGDITENSLDHNPGATNAFHNGGLLCGSLTLICDILKGFVPVFLYCRGEITSAVPLIIAAPVIGHVFPLFYRGKGGKGIAVTFGCLLGLFPVYLPLLVFALFFIFFSLVICITPHFYRTIITYFCSCTALFVSKTPRLLVFGFLIITLTVCLRFALSYEEKERFQIKLWIH